MSVNDSNRKEELKMGSFISTESIEYKLPSGELVSLPKGTTLMARRFLKKGKKFLCNHKGTTFMVHEGALQKVNSQQNAAAA